MLYTTNDVTVIGSEFSYIKTSQQNYKEPHFKHFSLKLFYSEYVI